MQSKLMDEQELVKQCMEELCKKAGFANGMTQRDLEFLCESIETQTGVLISSSTIRRLMQGLFSRQPQAATLNAIAQFTGYQNWQDFRMKKIAEVPEVNSIEVHEEKPGKKKFPTRIIVLASILVFAGIGLFAALHKTKQKPANLEKATFSVRKTTSNDLPNTVVFNYNVEDVVADSFFIQQSWDKRRRVKIDKNSHTLTDIYYEPGYHVAKLIANDQVIKTMDVSIPTDRWFFYAKEKSFSSNPPVYIFPSDSGVRNGSLQLNKEDVTKAGLNFQDENQYIQVCFPTQIEYSSDNFILHCRIRVHQLSNVFCPYFMCEVFCQKNFMFFTSAPKGCASEMMAQFGEIFLSGKTNDFSAIATNVNEWQDVIITVQNRRASIRMNGREVFSTQYNKPSGLITGLGFISNGLPEVDFVKLQTLDGKTIYSNDFGNQLEK
jgi:transcriptional regulator with XRE-family HTH domain